MITALIFLVIIIFTLITSANAQTYDMFMINRQNSDTTWMKRNTDSLYHKNGFSFDYIGSVSPTRLTPWPLLVAVPQVLTDTLTLAARLAQVLSLATNSILDSMQIFTAGGRIRQKIKIWADTLSPTTSDGYSINISSAGFTRILSAQVIGYRNSGTASSSPQVSVKSYTNSALVVNITETNTSTVTILGINVLSGLPLIFASITGLKLMAVVIGY